MSENNEGAIVGIDLGTTNSVVAAVIDGKPQVLAENGENILSSVVGIDNDGQLITGTVARNQLAAFPERTIASVKRKMGTMEKITLAEQSFTPPEISAMILRRLRDRAARALGVPVKRAVITVPAFFDENQRQATREAGELAGLQVERIINEPTASTLVYHAGSRDPKHIVVYDFGGGTFDVSVVRTEDGVIEVLSSQGDTQLGGDDIDNVLLNHVADEFAEEHQIDLRENMSTRYRLRQACEKAKCALSQDESVQITEEFIAEKQGRPLNLNTTISRNEFEEMITALVDRTIESVDKALREVSLTAHQIDDLVLVGGSTRIPLVTRRLREEFLREPSRAVDPDLAVALGAATQAAMHDGQSIGPVLVDVATHTLGIEACEGIMAFGPRTIFSPMIHRNTPLPARYEQAYSTMHDEQTVATIHVLQGEHNQIERNESIGEFKLDLETGGENHKIVVRFDLTLDGTLKVVATQATSGAARELTINNALSQFQSDERDKAQARLGAMFDSSAELLEDEDSLASSNQWQAPVDGEQGSSVAEPFPAAVALLEQVKNIGSSVADEDAEEIRSLTSQLENALSRGATADVDVLCAELDDILFYVQ